MYGRLFKGAIGGGHASPLQQELPERDVSLGSCPSGPAAAERRGGLPKQPLARRVTSDLHELPGPARFFEQAHDV